MLYHLLSTLYGLPVILYALRCTIHPSSTSYSLYSRLYAVRSNQALPPTLCTLRFTIYPLLSMHFLLSSTLYAVQSTQALPATLCTLRSTLYALRFTIYHLLSTHYLLSSNIYTLPSTIYSVSTTCTSLHSMLFTIRSTIGPLGTCACKVLVLQLQLHYFLE